jgi:hypothetical protein
MSTLLLRAPHVPNMSGVWPGISRLASTFSTVLAILVEARRLSIAAQKAYPRAEW